MLSKDRAEFADYIGANPEAGKVIPGLKGVRKIRWGHKNRGERGGARVIYLYVIEAAVVDPLDLYGVIPVVLFPYERAFETG